jgi:hypothetical protein
MGKPELKSVVVIRRIVNDFRQVPWDENWFCVN